MNVPRLLGHTARMRLTVLFGGAFLLCGAALLVLIYLLSFAATTQARSGFDATSGTANAGSTTAKATATQVSGFDLHVLLVMLGLSLAVTALAAVALGWFIAGRVLRPLSVITAAARRISAHSLHERLALRGPDDELKDLGDTLDALFARLEAAFEAQHRFVANASHELRTPLTRERALLQVTASDPTADLGTWQEVSAELLASNTEQERLIEALLTLAVSEGGVENPEPVDLADATATALAFVEPGTLDIRVATWSAPLDGDPVLVERLAGNLIGNAVRHNVAGGYVEIATRAENGSAVLSVSNSGPVISPDEVDRLFQPFQRLGSRGASRGRDKGHGLGLSIVQAIAAAHGAVVSARAQPAGGLSIDVAFPRRLDHAAGDARRTIAVSA
jgi:signal transduction histidine kinase